MEDYKGNSYKSKAEKPEKKVEKVVEGGVVTKKKSETHKLKDIFISEDASNVKSYIFMDVLVPAIKKAVKDIVTDGIEMILYGESGRRRDRGGTSASYVSYSNRFDDSRRDSRTDSRPRLGYNFDDIILKDRGDAEDVLTRMDELLDTYGMVSVADLYDLVGISCNYTDNKYGWTNLRNAEVMHTRDGYMLKLPKALPIN